MKCKYVVLFVLLLSALLIIPVAAKNADFVESNLEGVDFELYVEDDDLRILALNDINLADAYAYRETSFFPWTSEASEDEKLKYSDIQNVLIKYLNQAVSRTSPDLIVVTGNFVRGIDDYKGQLFNYLRETIDSYNIPWAYSCGSDERTGDYPFEDKLAALEKYENCIFDKGSVSGYN